MASIRSSTLRRFSERTSKMYVPMVWSSLIIAPSTFGLTFSSFFRNESRRVSISDSRGRPGKSYFFFRMLELSAIRNRASYMDGNSPPFWTKCLCTMSARVWSRSIPQPPRISLIISAKLSLTRAMFWYSEFTFVESENESSSLRLRWLRIVIAREMFSCAIWVNPPSPMGYFVICESSSARIDF